MCGIFGAYHWRTGRPVDPADIRRGLDLMVHRGPDAGGTHLCGPVGLGHRRLSIIDLTSGDQPLFDETGQTVIVYNGEVYNFRDLGRQLEARGFTFRTTSDTEVVLQAYRAFGLEFVSHLQGMFALAIWDASVRRLVLARDRVGIKPLLLASTPDGLLFSSEMKGLLASQGVDRRIDHQALTDFLQLNYVLGPRTLVAGLHKLPPGHYAVVDSGGVRQERYWDLEFREGPVRNVETAAATLAQLLGEQVRNLMVADVPVGAFLSGGVDSAGVTSAMTRVATEKVRTFTIGFEDPEFSEAPMARAASVLLGTVHEEIQLARALVPPLAELAWYCDEPVADSSLVACYYLARAAADRVKVCLSGDGGDEAFAGYPTYVADRIARAMGGLGGRTAASVAAKLSSLVRPRSVQKLGLRERIQRFLRGLPAGPEERHFWWRVIHTPDAVEKLLQPDVRAGIDLDAARQVFRGFYRSAAAGDDLQRNLYVDVNTWLADDILPKVDRSSMAASLEVRVPFLEATILEFAASLPSRMKLHGLRTKHVLKRALDGMLPRAILHRRKSGFSSPVGGWLRGPLRDSAQRLAAGDSPLLEWLDQGQIKRLVRAHLTHAADCSLELWGLLTLSTWLEHVYVPLVRGDGAAAAPARSRPS